jgi:hypothetical protein
METNQSRLLHALPLDSSRLIHALPLSPSRLIYTLPLTPRIIIQRKRVSIRLHNRIHKEDQVLVA